MVIADFEAGIGTITRLGEHKLDLVLVVVEATPKSIEVGSRAADLAREKSLGRIIVVANRIRNEDDLAMICSAMPGFEVVAIPDDRSIFEADRLGVSPLDLPDRGPAVHALVALAESLPIGVSYNSGP